MRLRIVSLGVLLLVIPLLAQSVHANATAVSLGNAAPFAVLGGSTVTNTLATVVITGDVGVSPGSSITGFPPGSGTIITSAATTLGAHNAATTAFNNLFGESGAIDKSGTNLGGLTLTPGLYSFSSSAQLTGTLTLDAQNNPNAVWVFQIGSTLTTASASSVVIINQAANASNGLFWEVGSSATIGATTDFEGNIVAQMDITMGAGATDDCGRLLALTGAVTLHDNTIGIGCTDSDVTGEGGSGGLSGGGTGGATPESGTLLLAGFGLLGLLALRRNI